MADGEIDVEGLSRAYSDYAYGFKNWCESDNKLAVQKETFQYALQRAIDDKRVVLPNGTLYLQIGYSTYFTITIKNQRIQLVEPLVHTKLEYVTPPPPNVDGQIELEDDDLPF